MLVMNMNLGGQLSATEGYPINAKTKSLYFIKKEPMVFPREDMEFKNNLIYGDLSHQPLEQLVTFIEDVCLLLIY